MTAAVLILQGGQESGLFVVEAGAAQDGDEPLADAYVDVSPVADRPVGTK